MKRLWTVIASLFIIAGVAGLLTFGFQTSEERISYSKTIDAQWGEVKKIVILGESDDLNVRFEKSATSGDQIKIDGKVFKSVEDQLSNAKIENGELTLDFRKEFRFYLSVFNFDFDFPGQNIVVSLGLPDQVESVRIETASGNIKTENVQANAVKISSASGDQKIDGVRSNKVLLESASGNIDGNDIASFTRVSTASGNITLKNHTGGVEGDAASGNITVVKKDTEVPMVFSTSSGNVSLSLPNTFGGSYDLDTVSGDIRAPKAKHLSTDAVKVSTVSGNITILEQ